MTGPISWKRRELRAGFSWDKNGKSFHFKRRAKNGSEGFFSPGYNMTLISAGRRARTLQLVIHRTTEPPCGGRNPKVQIIISRFASIQRNTAARSSASSSDRRSRSSTPGTRPHNVGHTSSGPRHRLRTVHRMNGSNVSLLQWRWVS